MAKRVFGTIQLERQSCFVTIDLARWPNWMLREAGLKRPDKKKVQKAKEFLKTHSRNANSLLDKLY